jgi:hypothetical protein
MLNIKFGARNNQLMEADSDRQDRNSQKILKTVTVSGSATITLIYDSILRQSIFKNLNWKTSLKGKINLIRHYLEVHIYSLK